MDIEELRESSKNSQPITTLRNLKLPVYLPITSRRDVDRIDIWLDLDGNFNSLVRNFSLLLRYIRLYIPYFYLLQLNYLSSVVRKGNETDFFATFKDFLSDKLIDD